MSDRTCYTLSMVMSDLTEEQIQALVDDVFEGHADSVDSEHGFIEEYERTVGDVYDGDMVERLQTFLDANGLDRPWALWEDPKYDWLGTVCIHEPGKRDRIGDCDAYGQLVITARNIEALLDDSALDEDGLRAGLRLLLGREAR